MRISDLQGLGAGSFHEPAASTNLLIALVSNLRAQAQAGQTREAQASLERARFVFQALGSPDDYAPMLASAQDAVTRSDVPFDVLTVVPGAGHGVLNYEALGTGTQAQRRASPYSLVRTREGIFLDPVTLGPKRRPGTNAVRGSSTNAARAGLGHPTLAEHGAACPPGAVIFVDESGSEVCLPLGLGAVAPASVSAQVRELNRQARVAYLGGDPASASVLLQQARDVAGTSDSPAYFSDDFTFTEQVLSGDPAAAQAASSGEARVAAGTANAESPYGSAGNPSLSQVADEIGPIGAVFYPEFALENDLAIPGRPVASVTEAVAAEMRQVPGPTRTAATPQSGRDLTTKPPVALPKFTPTAGAATGAAIGVTLGASAGAALGKTQGALTGGILGGILGGLLGYATGTEPKK